MKSKSTLKQLLEDFYTQNGIPKDGGVDDKTFVFSVFGLSPNLPNPKFRREALHIHDIQHVLNNQDTSWKGEGYIAGWEISTGMWKHFKLGVMSLWAMGYSLWIYPKSVFKGFKKGTNKIGVIDLNKSKAEFMKMEFAELLRLTKKEKSLNRNLFLLPLFIFWTIVSQFIFLFPLLTIILLGYIIL